MHLYQRSPRVQAVAQLDQGFTVIRRVLLEKTIIHHDVISRKRLGLWKKAKTVFIQWKRSEENEDCICCSHNFYCPLIHGKSVVVLFHYRHIYENKIK